MDTNSQITTEKKCISQLHFWGQQLNWHWNQNKKERCAKVTVKLQTSVGRKTFASHDNDCFPYMPFARKQLIRSDEGLSSCSCERVVKQQRKVCVSTLKLSGEFQQLSPTVTVATLASGKPQTSYNAFLLVCIPKPQDTQPKSSPDNRNKKTSQTTVTELS